MKMTQDVGTLSQAVAQAMHPFSHRGQIQMISIHFLNNFLSFHFKNVPEQVKDPEGFVMSNS